MEKEPQPADAPEQIGPFKILGVLGEGGMGTVYLAEQKAPVRRRVALKVIKLGMDTKRVLARFEVERQALAQMEHDGIARVYDAGTTETGQPYFAMEHVKGVPITQYCDGHKLGVRARLELFAQVCGAVQHAHHKGVIHRDLTPRNIMVSLQDGTPATKIIDFGLARATNQSLTDKTLYTEPGVVLGTPEYMSPEQAGFDGLDVDTRTDVYSLGVILYELLVGDLPFSSAELRNAGPIEAQRVIREQDPPRPSTKLSSAGDGSAERAQKRSTDVGDLTKRLRGDLDWIVMRALEKDRTRRYGTPESLANDVRRYLDGDPVLARPPTVGYRVAKFVRRNRGPVVTAALVLVTLLAGLIGTGLFALEAHEQGEIAGEKATEAERRSAELDVANDELARSLRTTRAVGLANAAQDEIRSDPTRAMLLALEAMAIERRPETRSALHRALALCYERKVFVQPSRAGCMDVSADGQRFVTGDRTGVVRLWSRESGLLWERPMMPELSELDNDLRMVRFFGVDGDRIVSGNWRGDLVLWNEQGDQLDHFASDTLRQVASGTVPPDHRWLLVGFGEWNGSLGFAQLFELASPGRDALVPVGEPRRHAGPVSHFAVGPDAGDGRARLVATGATNGRVQLWTVELGGLEPLMENLLPETASIRSLDFADDGRALLIGTLSSSWVYDLDRFEVREFGPGGWAGFLAPDRGAARHLVVPNASSWVTVVDADGHSIPAGQFRLPVLSSGNVAAVSPERSHGAVGLQDGRTVVFDSFGNELATLTGHGGLVQDVRFVGGHRQLVSRGWAGTTRVWDLDDDELVWRPRQGVKVVQHGRDGSVFTVCGEQAELRNPEGDVVLTGLTADGIRLPRHAFSTDRSRLALSWGTWLSVYDARTGARVGESSYLGDGQLSFCWLPRSDAVMYFDIEGGHVLDLRTGTERAGPEQFVTNVTSVAPSPDGDAVVVVSGETAEVHRRAEDAWELVSRLEAPLAYCAVFSPDGARVLVGTGTGSIPIFETDGTYVRSLLGHHQQIRAIVFSPDSSMIASASHDGTARLWTADGELIAVLEGPDGSVIDCSFTPDGNQLWTANRDDGTVRKWFVRDVDLIEAARKRASRELTSEERERFAELLGK